MPKQADVTNLVLEAYSRDAFKNYARMSYDTMEGLRASTGDIVGIVGKSTAYSVALPLYPSETGVKNGKEIVRINEGVRKSIGVDLGNLVKLFRYGRGCADASTVALELQTKDFPLEKYRDTSTLSLGFNLSDNVVYDGILVRTPYLGSVTEWKVVGHRPSNVPVRITESTYFDVQRAPR
jgi:hypothetical protein